MADISSLTTPAGNTYNLKDATARSTIPASASINDAGLITHANSAGTTLYTLQLPIYSGSTS